MHDHYHNVNTDDRFADLIDTLIDWDRGITAIDIETTGLDAWAPGASVVSISLTDRDEETWVVPLDHPEGPWGHEWQHRHGEIVDALRVGRVPLVAHNANFDLGWLRRHTGISLMLLHDTQTWAHLVNENQSKRLKSLAHPLMEGQWDIDVRDCKSVPWFTLAPYNAWDTIATMRLYKKQMAEASKRVSILHERVVLPAQEALMGMEYRGMWLDAFAAAERLAREEASADEAAMMLMSTAMLYGMEPDEYSTVSWEPTSKWFLAFTEHAVEDGGLEVQEMTPAGRPSWRGGVLTRQAREGSEVAQWLLDYRDSTKKAQFIRSWIGAADMQDRVHGRYNIARARTGRLTSSDPNMQQIARDLKPLWGAGPRSLLAEIDYSQIEMRVAAQLIHQTVLPDNPMLQAFVDGADLHSMAATLVTGTSVDEVTKDQRQAGKAINFGFLFGMGAAKFVQYADEVYGVEFTLEQAEEVREGYFDLWKGLGEWHDYMIRAAHRQGYVENPYYRRRHLPEVFTEDKYEVSQAERQAINSIVQGTASDMMMEAIGRFDRRHPDLLLATVHDSVLMVADDIERVRDMCDIMVNPSILFDVPLEVEASIGPRWGQYDDTFVVGL